MRRVNRYFVVIVIGSVLAGGAAATTFGSDLRTIDTIATVEGQVGTEVTDLRVVDDELLISVRLTNPTGFSIELRGTFVRVFRGDPTQLAYGAGQRVDDGSDRVPPRGRLDARYAVNLDDEQTERLRTAFESGPVRLTVFHSLSLQDRSFQIARSNITVNGEVGR
jgi:hypothetical protein